MSLSTKLVGIGEMVLSTNPADVITAPNLGSCVGVAAYDPEKKIGALIHCLLPMSKNHAEKADVKPYTFVDIGVVMMFQELIKAGADKSNLVICVAGGSNINDENNVFEIGKKNYTVLRKVLWKNNFLIKGEHIGDNYSRTLSLTMSSGDVTVKVNGEVIKLG